MELLKNLKTADNDSVSKEALAYDVAHFNSVMAKVRGERSKDIIYKETNHCFTHRLLPRTPNTP